MLAADLDLAGVGLVDAGEDLDQGRLAGAVAADQRVDRAPLQLQKNVVQGLSCPERLRHTVSFEDSRRPISTRSRVEPVPHLTVALTSVSKFARGPPTTASLDE